MRDDRAALARVIRGANPDLVCVQEAPRFLRWRSTCAALARTSGLVVVGGGRVGGANLIMSTLAVDVVDVACVAFSTDPGLHHRGAAIAVAWVVSQLTGATPTAPRRVLARPIPGRASWGRSVS